jgi:uncharacterized OB-fold protein
MIAPGVQVPAGDDVTTPWWDATREHRYVLQTCDACGGAQHPPRSICILCHATDALSFAASPGTGVVDTFTVVHRGPRPDVAVPYVIARVRLDEGPIVITQLVGRDVEAWTIGDAVAVEWHDLDDGRALPVFAPGVGAE